MEDLIIPIPDKIKLPSNNKYYKELIYLVEKRITNEDTHKNKDYFFKGINLYILLEPISKIRIAYLSSNIYYNNQEIRGEILNFIKFTNQDADIMIETKVNEFGNKYYVKSTGNTNPKREFKFNLKEMYFKMIKSTDSFKYINNHKVHQTRIAVDNFNWAKQNLKKMRLKSIPKKFKSLLCQDSIFDDRIFKILISEMFNLSNHNQMILNDHKIILTQGGTGKSSLLGVVGYSLDDVSEAGLYGHSNPKQSQWEAGKITNTRNTILIDEINEMVKKSTSSGGILKNLNTQLENGVYESAKAFGCRVEFSNQFIFMGNVSDTFNFEQMVSLGFANTDTIGRRLGYILYDDNTYFKKGKKLRLTKPTKFINSFRQVLSDTLQYYLVIKRYDLKMKTDKSYVIEEWYKKEINKIIADIEQDDTIKFLREHKKSCDRLRLMALKLSIYHFFDKIYKCNVNKFPQCNLIDKYHYYFKEVCKDNLVSFNNIKTHLKDSVINNNDMYHKENLKNSFNAYQLLIIQKLQPLLNENCNIILYKDLEYKGKLKYYKLDLLRRQNMLPKEQQKFQQVGFTILLQNNEIVFRLSNLKLFKEKTTLLFGESYDEIDLSKPKPEPKIDNLDSVDVEKIEKDLK